MTVSLENIHRRHESMLKTIEGFPFPGVVYAAGEGTIPSYDFSETRFLLRVRTTSPVREGMVVVDPNQRVFLTARHDYSLNQGAAVYRTLRLFPATQQLKWQREQTTLDPLTQLERGNGKADLGMIWALKEPITKEPIDLTLRIKEQAFRIITNVDLRDGDILDDMVVRRVDKVLGLTLAELQ